MSMMDDNFPFKPMTIYKIVYEVINGVEREFVMIDREEYENYISFIAFKNKKLVDADFLKKKQEQEQRQEEAEQKRINEIEERARREEVKEQQRKLSIEKEILINRHHNEKTKKLKEELKDEYKEIFKSNENAKIQKCGFCNNWLVYPIHFLDENDKPYKREYTEDKQKKFSICCLDCYQNYKQQKEDYKLRKTERCIVCDCTYLAFNDNMITAHINTNKHKRNKEIYENNLIRNKEESAKKNLALLTVKELNKICSKSIKSDGTYYINNYSKIKKNELIKLMYDNYQFLIF